MRPALLAPAALIGLIGLTGPGAMPAAAQESITVRPEPRPESSGNGTEFRFKPLNNPNYLDYGPLPDDPGSDKSEDYMNQAGGDDPAFSGPGSDQDADIMPDNDGAYDGP